MTRRRQYSALLWAAGLAMLFGGAWWVWSQRHLPAGASLYPVRGRVLVDGEPIENLNVAFHPLDGGARSLCPVGRTDSKGIFSLTTRASADGAPAGKYSVTFVRPNDLIDECECPDPTLHDQFHGFYAQADQLVHLVNVGSASNRFWFNLRRPSLNAK